VDRVREGMTVAEVQKILGGRMAEPSTPDRVDPGLVDALSLPKGAKPENIKIGLCDMNGQIFSIVFFEGKVVAVPK